MATAVGTGRKLLGGVSTLLLLFWLLIARRALSLWLSAGIRFQLVAFGFHLVIIALIFAGVVWGFWGGEKAEKIYGGGVMLIATGCFLASFYYWTTGFILSRNRLSIYGALVLFFTGIVVVILVAIIGKVASSSKSESPTEPQPES